MKREFIDTEVEIQYAEIERIGDQKVATDMVLGQLRRSAQVQAHEVGGRLDPTRLPEIVIKRTSSVLLGGDLLLVAARWAVEVPDSFVLPGRA